MVELFPQNRLPRGHTVTHHHQTEDIEVNGPIDSQQATGENLVYYEVYNTETSESCYVYYTKDSREFYGIGGTSASAFDVLDSNSKLVTSEV